MNRRFMSETQKFWKPLETMRRIEVYCIEPTCFYHLPFSIVGIDFLLPYFISEPCLLVPSDPYSHRYATEPRDTS